MSPAVSNQLQASYDMYRACIGRYMSYVDRFALAPKIKELLGFRTGRIEVEARDWSTGSDPERM